MYYSEKLKAVIPHEWKEDGTYPEWPDDAILMTDDEYNKYWVTQPPSGKMLGVVDGRLAWVDLPPLSPEELLFQAVEKKAALTRDANDFINTKQWPSKVALGRLKDAEKAQFNLWLDYLDAIDAIDTSKPKSIKWPEAPTP